jgi:hypothetical protein
MNLAFHHAQLDVLINLNPEEIILDGGNESVDS